MRQERELSSGCSGRRDADQLTKSEQQECSAIEGDVLLFISSTIPVVSLTSRELILEVYPNLYTFHRHYYVGLHPISSKKASITSNFRCRIQWFGYTGFHSIGHTSGNKYFTQPKQINFSKEIGLVWLISSLIII